MSTIQENLDRILNAKSAIKDAIIQKGIEVTDTEKIETYADKILQIKSGGAEIPEFDPNGPLTIYCFDDWGDAYVKFSNRYKESTILYSTDGSTWKTYTDETIKLTRGQYVLFKGVITQYAAYFYLSSTFILKGGLFNLYGNLTSLDNYISIYNDGFKYTKMFNDTNVYDCSKLNTGIKTIKGGSIFNSMFIDCKYLVKVPELPVTTLADNCYSGMFLGCTSLTTIPSNLLPATTLEYGCYSNMFLGCTSLTTIPNLPATTLAISCYENMFEGCPSLVETPEGWYLPAQTTTSSSCNSMFANCSNLQKMAVAYSGTITSSHWSSFLQGVSSTGTFYYSKNQTEEKIRPIVPEGWTLVQSTEW